MPETSIEKLARYGQSIWLDNINRSLIESGKLKELISAGLRGLTSNPTIFDKAISQSSDYDDKISELSNDGKSVFEIYDDLTVRDIREAADLFAPVYESSRGLDGYVSLEINPELADNAAETVKEGRRLYQKAHRPNLMLKVPATEAGFVAVEELLAWGINVNVTLIFSVEQYVKAAGAFLGGIKRLSKKTGDLSGISSVASVFVSRVDTVADKMLDGRIPAETGATAKERLRALKGKAAVANSQLIFKKYLEMFSSKEFSVLKKKGARPQRALWGSTSTKNPDYSDIKYVTELIGKNTVNTMPDNTLEAFLDHGAVKEALTSDTSRAESVIADLKRVGIDVDDICAKLLKDGVAAFVSSFRSLLGSIEDKSKILCKK